MMMIFSLEITYLSDRYIYYAEKKRESVVCVINEVSLNPNSLKTSRKIMYFYRADIFFLVERLAYAIEHLKKNIAKLFH